MASSRGKRRRPSHSRSERLRDVLVVGVKLILDLSDDLLHDVLDGDDAGGAAVLVHHDDHLVVAGLHLGEQRDDVLGVGHVVGRAHVARDGRGALAIVKDGRDDVLDVRNAHDAVNGAVVDGDAAIAGAAHGGQDLGERRGVLHGGHVNAGDHDLAGDGVAQINDLVDHGLLLVGELLGVRDHVLELLLGDVLALVGGP